MRALRMELKKARRRYDLPVAALIGALVLIWASRSGARTADDLASGWSALLYGLPLMNTIIMPTGMAVLASRIWDVETKGNGCRLLFTLQSRGELLRGKLLLGLLENLLICAMEFGGLLALGARRGFTEPLDVTRYLWLLGGTFCVNAMLYLAGLWLGIRFANQVPVLAMGMVGSLSGIFAAFMPELVSYFVPWGYYIPLGTVRMFWDPDTRLAWYEPAPLRFWLLGVTLALAALFSALGRRELLQEEV